MLDIILAVLALVCIVLYLKFKDKKGHQQVVKPIVPQPLKKNLGEIQVFFGSQTGTAAKMASMFAEEAAQQGFSGVVIDLKNISHAEFQKNQISVFFMANTGEGQAPQNAVQFMKILSGKSDLEGETPNWQNMNYVVFGLGDTQYEHFNKIGIEVDQGLQKRGANRLCKIGLGDANSSLEDDFNEWKSSIWEYLIKFRQSNPLILEHVQKKSERRKSSVLQMNFLSSQKPKYANFQFIIVKQKGNDQINEKELDFKTKASLLGKISGVENIIQKRQDTNNGSSLQLQVVLTGQPEYQTAGNIALWPTSDPQIVDQIIKYFKLQRDAILDISAIDINKKNKFNFVAPVTVQQLLDHYLDLQFRITKGLLKKLSKFNSKSPDYFFNNSSAKTTEEYKRLSDHSFCYLFKLIKEYEVEITFEDFVELSQSVGPRLFTIASSWKAQKNVVVIASIVENGLISKHFNRNPKQIKAELRKSSFEDIFKWKKVIFIGAGTGFAPFRGYLQEKQLLKNEGKETPLITLYFGCKYQNSDFIYKEEILEWQKNGVIDKLNLAFSRQTQQKVYVQNLLQKNEEQVKQFIESENEAIYICGSLGMGKDVSKVLESSIEKHLGVDEKGAKDILTGWQKKGKLIKQLW